MHCFDCSRKLSPTLTRFVVLTQFTTDQLSVIYDNFTLTNPELAHAKSNSATQVSDYTVVPSPLAAATTAGTFSSIYSDVVGVCTMSVRCAVCAVYVLTSRYKSRHPGSLINDQFMRPSRKVHFASRLSPFGGKGLDLLLFNPYRPFVHVCTINVHQIKISP